MSRVQRQAGGAPAPKKGMTKQQQMLLLIGGIALTVVLAIVVTVAVFFSQNEPVEADSGDTSSSVSSSSSGDLTEETDYNKDEFVLDVEQLGATILPVTEDAGEEYVENTLFIGDSNTYRYIIYGQTTLKNDIGVIGMGIQDVLSKDCVKFKGYSDSVTIPEAVTIMQPQRIVICFGTNNAGNAWTPATMTEQYGLVLDAIEEAYPYADIIISAIPPVGRYHSNESITMSTIDSFNQALAKMAEERGCKFLNTSEVLKDPETGFMKNGYTVEDGIHMTKPAVEALFEYVRTHAYVTEDRRPKPLKTVPDRDEPEPFVIDSERPYTDTRPNSSSSKKDGLDIVFTVNDAAMGTISGELEQTVPVGESCTKVTANPKEGYSFAYWSCTVGRIEDVNKNELSFVVPGGANTDKIVVSANFVKSGYQVKVSSSNTDMGSAGIRVGNDLYQDLTVERGNAVNLYAQIRDNKYRFNGWYVRENGTTRALSTAAEYAFTPAENAKSPIEIVAQFGYNGVVQVDASGGGSVTNIVNDGNTLSATAVASSGYTFDHWNVNGNNYGSDANISLKLDQYLDVVAFFKAIPVETVTFGVAANPAEGGSVSANPAPGSVAKGTSVTLTATANSGYHFVSWSTGATEATITVTINEATTITANFEKDAPVQPTSYTVTISAGENGSVSPAGAQTVTAGGSITITATPAEGYIFARWEGADTSSTNPLTITVNGDLALKAIFELKPVEGGDTNTTSSDDPNATVDG